MNEFLKTKDQIDQATKWLIGNGYQSHPISCKDYELAEMTKYLEDGDIIDLGANGSFVLHNAIIKNIKGRKVGVDLSEVAGFNKAEGVEYYQQDLMNTSFEDNSFDTIFCASVIEHQVDIKRFSKECSRLLRSGGTLFLSFDYYNPKPDTSKTKLYSLDWNILDEKDVLSLIHEMELAGLTVGSEIDWTLSHPVITDTYCSPAKDVSYTFGLFAFIKTGL